MDAQDPNMEEGGLIIRKRKSKAADGAEITFQAPKSRLGLDVLAKQKREEAASKESASKDSDAFKKPRISVGWDAEEEVQEEREKSAPGSVFDAKSSGEFARPLAPPSSASSRPDAQQEAGGDSKSKERHYRQPRMDTPSNPGGVSTPLRKEMEERSKERVFANSRWDRRPEDHERDRERERDRDRERERDRGRRDDQRDDRRGDRRDSSSSSSSSSASSSTRRESRFDQGGSTPKAPERLKTPSRRLALWEERAEGWRE